MLAHKRLEGVESSVRERNAQGNMLWMWSRMWSPIRTRPKQTSILPWMLGKETTSKTTQILSNKKQCYLKSNLFFIFSCLNQTVFLAVKHVRGCKN